MAHPNEIPLGPEVNRRGAIPQGYLGRTALIPHSSEVLAGSAESALLSNFDNLVDELDFLSLAIPIKNRTIDSSESFRLIPVGKPDSDLATLSPAGATGPNVPGIRCTYGFSRSDPPYLDTRQAIGLVNRNHLIAVGGAGIDNYGRLNILQLQVVTGLRKPKADAPAEKHKEYSETGLESGFRWRETLISAWEEIALKLGVHESIVQASANSKWSEVRALGFGPNDIAAKRMGYKRIIDTEGSQCKDWGRSLN